jgi:hypothetical protein
MATLQNCDGVLNDLSRNADRPAVFTLRKRGSETWSYADLDGCEYGDLGLSIFIRHPGSDRAIPRCLEIVHFALLLQCVSRLEALDDIDDIVTHRIALLLVF